MKIILNLTLSIVIALVMTACSDNEQPSPDNYPSLEQICNNKVWASVSCTYYHANGSEANTDFIGSLGGAYHALNFSIYHDCLITYGPYGGIQNSLIETVNSYYFNRKSGEIVIHDPVADRILAVIMEYSPETLKVKSLFDSVLILTEDNPLGEWEKGSYAVLELKPENKEEFLSRYTYFPNE